MRIVGTQLTRSQKLQVWVGVPVSGFWPWIWTWDALPQSLFSVCSHRTKKNTRLTLCQELENQIIRLNVTQTFFLRSSQVTKVGAMGMTLRPNKLRANGRCPLHWDQKKQDKQGQMWEWCSLFFSMFEEIYSSWTDCQSGILLGSFEVIERECAKKTPRIVEIGWLVSPSWQHLSSHSFVCDPVFGLSGMDSCSPPSPLWFLFIPDNEKKTLKGKRFVSVEEVKTALQEALNNIKLQQFHRCFTQWEKRLDKCITSNGEYFEVE